MLWPVLTFLALAALGLFHFRWHVKLKRARAQSQREIADLRERWRRAAIQLQSQQDALFNSMAEGVLVLDDTGRIQLANRAFITLFGLSGDIRSRSIMEALRLHELADLVEGLRVETPNLERELRLSRPTERWVHVSGALIKDGADGNHGSILVFHDLTRLKQLEGVRQEFVANLSHELRTPLSLIKGYAETLLDGAKDNPQVAAKFLSSIERNAERLKLLIEDLLTISELESGRVQLALQSVPLRPLVEKLFDDFKTRTAAKNVSLLHHISDMPVRADALRLEQVLGNLLDNAIKYGRPNGTVTVETRAIEPAQVEISVRDDGPGIPPEALDRVFERFYRVDKARSREQGGTGLGLSIVKHIVQNHGGKVWATSEPGFGATFFLTLPQDSTPRQHSLP